MTRSTASSSSNDKSRPTSPPPPPPPSPPQHSVTDNGIPDKIYRSIARRTDSLLSADSFSSCSDDGQQQNASLRSKSEVYMEEASLEQSLDRHSTFVKRNKQRQIVEEGLIKKINSTTFIQLEQPQDGEGEIVASTLCEESISRELGDSFVSELSASVIDDAELLTGKDEGNEQMFQTFDGTESSRNWRPRDKRTKVSQ
eukprot:9771054-Ditylum_brightwellii.AAC.1